MRERAEKTLGSAFDIRKFHTVLLASGRSRQTMSISISMPMPMPNSKSKPTPMQKPIPKLMLIRLCAFEGPMSINVLEGIVERWTEEQMHLATAAAAAKSNATTSTAAQ